MFAIIRRPSRRHGNPWLGDNERLFSLRLENVENVFDAHSLWDHRYGGKREIVESLSQRNDLRLKAALDAHRCITTEIDARGWRSAIERVFTDVVIRIPEPIWQQDIELGAKNLTLLTDNLSNLHKDDFGTDLLGGRHPGYVIMPDTALPVGQIWIQFGMGVFVPGTADKQVARIRIKTDRQKNWHALPKWLFWENGYQVKRPVGIYEQQSGLMLGAGLDFAAVPTRITHPPIWFEHGKGYIFINYALRIDKYAFGDGVFVDKGSIDDRDNERKKTVFVFKNNHQAPMDRKNAGPPTVSPEGPREAFDPQKTVDPILEKPPSFEQDAHQPTSLLYLKITAIHERQPAPMRPEQTKARVPAQSQTSTFIKGNTTLTDTEAVASGPALILEGYALPRIDRLKVAGLKRWMLWLDQEGQPVNTPFSTPDQADTYTTLSASADSPTLYIRNPGQPESVEIGSFPQQIHTGGDMAFEIVQPPDDLYYLGILRIAEPTVFIPLIEDSIILGRGDTHPELAPDVAVDVLNNPQGLIWEKGRTHRGAFLGAIGLGRRHVKVALEKDNLQVLQLSRSSPVFGVDGNGTLKEKLEPETGKTMCLVPGDRLLIGCCLLRFETWLNPTGEPESGPYFGDTLIAQP